MINAYNSRKVHMSKGVCIECALIMQYCKRVSTLGNQMINTVCPSQLRASITEEPY